MPADRGGPVAGVILAAGSSSRLGRNKLLVPIGGTTLLRRAATAAIEAGLDPVLVVLGHELERTLAELGGLDCRAVPNPDHAQGINTSLRAGIRAVPPEAPAAVVLLADMPLVTARMIRAVVGAFRAGSAPLVLSTYGGVLAPPTLYARALFPELGAPSGEGCGKRVMTRHRAEAAELAWPADALADIDLPGDLDRVRRALEEPS
jgi:molybdenum cofactor cytidylyltransferase